MRRFLSTLLLLALTGSNTALADSRTPGKVIAGWVEKVTMQPWDIVVSAKLDTGALTSSIYAVDVERVDRDGERWGRFTLVLEDADDEVHRSETEAPLARSVRIKDHDDPSSRRAVVELALCFDGRKRSTQFSLADRGSFIYPVLLGRRFLEDIAVVDPAATFMTQAECS